MEKKEKRKRKERKESRPQWEKKKKERNILVLQFYQEGINLTSKKMRSWCYVSFSLGKSHCLKIHKPLFLPPSSFLTKLYLYRPIVKRRLVINVPVGL